MNTRKLFVPAVLLMVSCAWAEIPATQPAGPLEPGFTALSNAKGQDYIAARTRLLSHDKSSLQAFLQTQRSKATPIEQLCIEALLSRVRDPARLDDALAATFHFAETHRSLNALGDSHPPDSSRVAQFLVEELGEDACPLAAELLFRGLANDWPVERREMLLIVVILQGSQRLNNGTYSAIKDKRAGEVVLWCLLNETDPELKDRAKRSLGRFAAPDLVKSVRAAQEREGSQEMKNTLDRLAQRLEREARIRASTTQPSSSPSISLTTKPQR